GCLTEEQLRYAKRVHSKLTGSATLLKVLQDLRYITPEQLRDTLVENRLNLKIGTLLVELGYIEKNELEIAINIQKETTTRKTIGEILVESGFIEEHKLLEVLSYQLGIPYSPLDIARMDRQLLRKIPVRWYSLHQFLPLSQKGGKTTVAFADPLNRDNIEAAEKIFGQVEVSLCSKSDFREIIGILERDQAVSTRVNEPDEKSVVGMVNSILDEAVRSGTSDIHIEPMRDKLRVRFRLDGVLVHHRDLPLEMSPAIASRLKIMSKADIAERRRHQGGRILFENPLTGASLDLRISFYVTVWGEKIVLRLLNRKNQLLDMNEIGMFPKMLERFRYDALDIPSGVILVTGPTGSGKTTTLYSSINYLENINTCIVTVEDPVEYLIDGIAQCSIDPKINLTFEESLKHVVRQDPDVIVIGEIRDSFSAETCIQASLTGHKVLSTFHTEDSIGGLIRLLNMNIEPFLISSTVVGVVAQRLLRKVCPNCAEEYVPQPSELYRLGYSGSDMRGVRFTLGRGCSECRFTGYKGRAGVFELLILNEPVKDAVLNKKTSYEIRRISTESSGLTSLLEDGIVKAAAGATSLQEVFRSLPRVSKPRSVHELRRLLGAEQ
ncbi:MAG: Flp pilus assembly complex ATPase component TadA, partial [Desulfobacteraceae bacterium]|nr:Flp pilus assembly complex ATPase component TadA [Desulfobacteraceae bacterium]